MEHRDRFVRKAETFILTTLSLDIFEKVYYYKYKSYRKSSK